MVRDILMNFEISVTVSQIPLETMLFPIKKPQLRGGSTPQESFVLAAKQDTSDWHLFHYIPKATPNGDHEMHAELTF